MRYRKTEIWKSVDWITILLYLIMVIAGWFSICGASYEFDNVGLFDPSGRPGMQMIWIGTSLALIFVILMLESDFFDIFAYLIYACVIVLLIATIFLAPNIKGSHSWLVLGPIRLQPAELAKFATALAVAKFMNGYGFKLTTVKNFSITLFLIFLPMVCILLQKETGSALVYLAFFLMLYREGMTGYILLIGVCAVIPTNLYTASGRPQDATVKLSTSKGFTKCENPQITFSKTPTVKLPLPMLLVYYPRYGNGSQII